MLGVLNPTCAVTAGQRFDASVYTRTPSLGESAMAALRSCKAFEQRFQKVRRSHELLCETVLAGKHSYHCVGDTHGVSNGNGSEHPTPTAQVEVHNPIDNRPSCACAYTYAYAQAPIQTQHTHTHTHTHTR